MPKCSLKSFASSPIVIPCRIGMGYCPTNDSKPANEHRTFDLAAADRVGAIADDGLDAVLAAGPQAVGHRIDVGVNARADVLEVDDEDVEAGEHLAGRFPGFAVERVDGHMPHVVAGVGRFDHVLLEVGAEAVLRPEDGREARVAAGADAVGSVHQAVIDRRRVADHPDALARESAGRAEQAFRPKLNSCTA